MRSLWFVLVGVSVLVVTACFKFPKEEPISTIFPKGYTRPVALQKGGWQNGYNFALGEALQQADREGMVTEEAVIDPVVIPYAAGKAPTSKTAKMPVEKKDTSEVATVMAKGEKKLRRLVAKMVKRNNTRPAKNVMSATVR